MSGRPTRAILGIVGCAILAGVVSAGAASRDPAADRIVLRNLTVIDDREVVSFDADGVRLDDGETIPWDEIERASLHGGRQDEFDGMLKELGGPLYRIRQRLKVGDYQGLLPHAETVYPRFIGRSGRTAYMVFQSLMWGRLAVGRREAAVEPYLRCCRLLLDGGAEESQLPGRRRLALDRQTGLSPELTPIWFDSAAARQALPGVLRAVGEMHQPYPDGARIYYATLALAAGEAERARTVLEGVTGQDRAAAEWLEMARAQGEAAEGRPGAALARLESSWTKFSEENRPAALYWLGLSKTARPEELSRREGLLLLLRIPASYGTVQPDLAGAALYRAMVVLDQLNDPMGSAAVRKELLLRYAHTYHAGQVRAGAARGED